ncbi:MAG: hypothetical protein U0X91_30945 [Spirosomataceae bacterium]
METKTLKLPEQWVIIGGKVGKLTTKQTAAVYADDAALLTTSDTANTEKFKKAVMSAFLRIVSKGLTKTVRTAAMSAALGTDLSTAADLSAAVSAILISAKGIKESGILVTDFVASASVGTPLSVEFIPSVIEQRQTLALQFGSTLTHVKLDWVSMEFAADLRTAALQTLSHTVELSTLATEAGKVWIPDGVNTGLNDGGALRLTLIETKNQKQRRSKLSDIGALIV